jgi:hypothetical protein
MRTASALRPSDAESTPSLKSLEFGALLAVAMQAAAAPSAFTGMPNVDPSRLQPEPPAGAS